jgi:hypothetical protein
MILRFLRVLKLTWNIIIPFSFVSVNYISVLSLLWKSKRGLWRYLAVCLSVYPPLSTFECLNQFFSGTCYVYHGTCAFLIIVLHKSLPSVCVSMCIPIIVARQPFGRHFPAATNTSNSRNVGRGVLCTVRLVSKESLWVCSCIPLLLLGMG